MIATGYVDIEALLGIGGRVLEVAQTHIDASQQIQAIGLGVAGAMIQLEGLEAIILALGIILLVIEPLRSPVPHLLANRVGWHMGRKPDFFLGELFWVVNGEKAVGGFRRRGSVIVIEGFLDVMLLGQCRYGAHCQQNDKTDYIFDHRFLEIQ